MQIEVGQKRGDGAALGDSGRRLFDAPAAQASDREPAVDQTLDVAVVYYFAETCHQTAVVHRAKEVLDVCVDHPATTRSDRPAALSDGTGHTPAWAIAVRGVGK